MPNQRLIGHEEIRYVNNSPDKLTYLWLHLEPNRRTPESHSNMSRTAPNMDTLSLRRMTSEWQKDQFDGSCKIENVRLADGTPLKWTVVGTTMRIDLPKPLAPVNHARSMSGGSGPGGRAPQWLDFELDWSYEINNVSKVPSVSISVRHSPRINYCRGRRMKLTHGPSKRTAEHAPGRGIGA